MRVTEPSGAAPQECWQEIWAQIRAIEDAPAKTAAGPLADRVNDAALAVLSVGIGRPQDGPGGGPPSRAALRLQLQCQLRDVPPPEALTDLFCRLLGQEKNLFRDAPPKVEALSRERRHYKSEKHDAMVARAIRQQGGPEQVSINALARAGKVSWATAEKHRPKIIALARARMEARGQAEWRSDMENVIGKLAGRGIAVPAGAKPGKITRRTRAAPRRTGRVFADPATAVAEAIEAEQQAAQEPLTNTPAGVGEPQEPLEPAIPGDA